jgi:hypothetical protein
VPEAIPRLVHVHDAVVEMDYGQFYLCSGDGVDADFGYR